MALQLFFCSSVGFYFASLTGIRCGAGFGVFPRILVDVCCFFGQNFVHSNLLTMFIAVSSRLSLC